MNKKKWLTLSFIATALLLIPRRSSRHTLPDTKSRLKGQPSDSELRAHHKHATQTATQTTSADD